MNTHKLLIIDDDEQIGEMLKTIAEQCGFHVIFTDTALAFYEQLSLFEPDLIMVDLIMPDVDGVQLIERLADINHNAKLIIISGAGKRVVNSSAVSAQEHGMEIAGVLNKPFRTAEARQVLTDFIKHNRRRRPTAKEKIAPAQDHWFPGEDDLQQALDSGLINAHFQPKISSHTKLLLGFEVLARWHDEEHGGVRPDYFIQLAERTHQIDSLTRLVFDQAMCWFARLSRTVNPDQSMTLTMEPDNLTIAVNISVVNLQNRLLPDELSDCCEQHGVSPQQVILEVTETAAMENPTEMLDILTRLRIKGFGLAIDDFGVGYSSLIQLARLPFSELKVDRSFVMTGDESAESRAVIKSVVNLAKSLGLKSVAEGVESHAMRRYLDQIGCDILQGFAIAKPMAAEPCEVWIEEYYQTMEQQRVKALKTLDILDTPEEYRFDRITRLAKRLFDVPVALISFVDVERQWFKSHPDFDLPETPREFSFCAHALGFQEVFVVNNASEHPRFRNNELVTDADKPIRFYAGCPLQMPGGERLGTLCLIDSEPRHFSDQEKIVLQQLAALVEEELEADEYQDLDHLTQLFNRSAFERRSRSMLTLAERSQLAIYLLLIDIDDFRQFNELYGHTAGDTALIAIADILRENFRQSDIISRFSGDEFSVMMINKADREEIQLASIVDRINQEIDRVINQTLAPNSLKLTVSTGVATTSENSHFSYSKLLYEAQYQLRRRP
ncbi:EAL domain-containing protein [Idiomarina seosinensis]|uniref:EAL domain-containing protein n=1 Tax=Idiomarina seosinensis TaxID=281739 RepID=UPI00384A45FE